MNFTNRFIFRVLPAIFLINLGGCQMDTGGDGEATRKTATISAEDEHASDSADTSSAVTAFPDGDSSDEAHDAMQGREAAPIPPRLHAGKNADLLNELESSRAQLLNAIRSLTPSQWTFRESDERWSIGEIVEHLVYAERVFRGLIKDYVLEGDEKNIAESDRAQTDEEVLAFIRNRANRLNAPSPLQPAGVYESVQEGIDAFEKERALTIVFIEGTELNLRAFAKPFPGTDYKAMDGVQWFLYISGHTTRHVGQITQVRANASYPRQ